MSDPVNVDMSEFWNGAGGEKWVGLQDQTDKFLLPLGREAIAAAALSDGELVLDIGCGCGDTSFEMARRVGPAGRVHGLDISTPIVAEAKARKATLGQNNVTFERGDAQVQVFEAGSFNVAYSRFGIMFFDDPVAAFGNIRCALEPDGRLAFVCWQPVMDNQWISVPLGVVAKHLPLPAPPEDEAPGPFSFSDPSRIRRVLSDAGFSEIKVAAVNQSISLGSSVEEVADLLIQMGPAGSVISKSEADAATISRIAGDLRDALAPHDTGQGIELGAAAWLVTAHNSASRN